eukprot:m.31179 g.31179  ORF g.31179 m.31179 type:complete len:73 (-) comp9685_c0_seq1:670-888(-)
MSTVQKVAPALVLVGMIGGYFIMFHNHKKVDYVFEGREQRQAEGRKSSEQFRQAFVDHFNAKSDDDNESNSQ